MDKVEIPGDRQADKLKTMDEMENDFHLKKNNPQGGGGLCGECWRKCEVGDFEYMKGFLWYNREWNVII